MPHHPVLRTPTIPLAFWPTVTCIEFGSAEESGCSRSKPMAIPSPIVDHPVKVAWYGSTGLSFALISVPTFQHLKVVKQWDLTLERSIDEQLGIDSSIS